jgi:transposase
VPGVEAPQVAAQKKSPYAAERDSPRVRGLRAEYQGLARQFVLEHLVFIDESGVNLALTRTHGRAAPGERVVEGVPQNYGSNFTLLAALGLSGLSAPWMLEGSVDTESFQVYPKQVLGPTLKPGDIVVMDNLSVHKVSGLTELLTARGARLEYLPPYSPDLNPIEKCWSKIKTSLRKAKARTVEALEQALKEAFASITESDARAWFAHCGYAVH